MIKKVLIANRGEIAVRVIRSCREMDIPTVAIYSEADRTAPHVLMADEAVCVGPPSPAKSYLNVPAILDAAKFTGADAIHPGYGFLSENADFARKVASEGLTWIGPRPETIEAMGDKVSARKLAIKVNVPIVPGITEPVDDLDKATEVAKEIGFPVLIKAVGGGGGKGMRTVNKMEELASAFERAQSETASAFADDRVYIEKLVQEPHHVEIQVFADTHGNIVTLGERECSIQRRYQKVIEETPSPYITEKVRKKLAETALIITEACDYVGAGTVEFLVDKNLDYYFLEMNTRLQVEHPVTEMVTGIDLVAEQLRVASGDPLSFTQEDIQPTGHAIECRIYAEDGFNNFAPSIGDILEFASPGGFGVRLDHGVRSGLKITPYYDPMIGKLCTWGRNRVEAVARMARALEELRVVGLHTTIPFCLAVMRHSAFMEGQYCTSFISDYGEELATVTGGNDTHLPGVASLGAVLFTANEERKSGSRPHTGDGISSWLKSGRERGLRS